MIWNPVILFSFLSISERRTCGKERGWERHRRRAGAVCLSLVFGLCHCHSNVLLQEGKLRGEWEMSTNGEQREKWNNWIWLRLSVRTGQHIICDRNYLDSDTMCTTSGEVGLMWRTSGSRTAQFDSYPRFLVPLAVWLWAQQCLSVSQSVTFYSLRSFRFQGVSVGMVDFLLRRSAICCNSNLPHYVWEKSLVMA